MERVVVIGTTGSGKSTLAAALARRLLADFVELDALNWQAGWQSVPDEVFRQRVQQATDAPRWVVSGNYSKVRDLTWARADTLVWLDYPFPLVLWRLFRRTVQRIVTQEDLWDTGNHESWRAQFLSRDSLFLWAIQTHWRYRRSIAEAVQQSEYAHLHVIRFTSAQQAIRWLESVG